MNVTIVYVGLEPIDTRVVAGISRFFQPDGSYVDTPVYAEGLNTKQETTIDGQDVAYGKSIYATNVYGWGSCPGLQPLAHTPSRLAMFERAVAVAIEAAANDQPNDGVTFDIGDDYRETLYWEQLGANLADQGFVVTVAAA